MMSETTPPFDAILLVSFGGPEGPDDVMPFLENVLRGKGVPHQRMLEVAEHYQGFGGVSPINQQNRELIAALQTALPKAGIDLPIYWGNRNWHPLLIDTLRQMRDAGHQRVISFFTSMFSCYSGCRQYRENIQEARERLSAETPTVELVRKGFNHPLFVETQRELVGQALAEIDSERRSRAKLLFTAHSIPLSMADHSRYVVQLQESARLIAEAVGHDDYALVYQSRSGPPQQPWLEPDVCDAIEEFAQQGIQDFVLAPIGFISDHMEVIYDLDTEAKQLCHKLQVGFSRAATPGTHPKFVEMICELIRERVVPLSERPAVGALGPSHDVCPVDCCLYPRPQRPARG